MRASRSTRRRQVFRHKLYSTEAARNLPNFGNENWMPSVWEWLDTGNSPYAAISVTWRFGCHAQP